MLEINPYQNILISKQQTSPSVEKDFSNTCEELLFPQKTTAIGDYYSTNSIKNNNESNLEQLNKLFPNGELIKFYNQMSEELGLDIPPKLNFVSTEDKIKGGGYTFLKNEINMNLADLTDTNLKIVGIKNSKKETLVSPNEQLPLIVNKDNANLFLEVQAKKGNLGFDKLIAEPTSIDDRKKLILQKIYHELIHAQQHMIMRQTEGIGTKEIIKAWTHKQPKNVLEEYLLDIQANKQYNSSVWVQSQTNTKYHKDSLSGQIAKKWLEAIRNYPPIDSPEYTKNPIESDAYNRSAEYIKRNFGGWN